MRRKPLLRNITAAFNRKRSRWSSSSSSSSILGCLALLLCVLVVYLVPLKKHPAFHRGGGIGGITTLHFFRHVTSFIPPLPVQNDRNIPRAIILRPSPTSWLPNIVVYDVPFPSPSSNDDKCLQFGNADDGEAWSSPYSLEVDLLYILASMVDKGHYKMSVLANNLRQVKDTQASFDADERPTYFVVPHIGTCLSHQVNKEHAGKHIISILDLIAPHPFFSRNGGSDHVMLFMQDTGVCWFDNYKQLSDRVRPFVHVTNLGIDIDRYQHGFWVWDEVCFGGKRGIPVPQVRKPDFPKVAPGKLSPHQAVWPRPYLLTFRGTIHTIARYSHNTRQILFQERRRLDGSEQWVATGIQSDRFDLQLDVNPDLCKSRGFQCYHETLALHTFALCPGGWEPWSPRLYDAMYDGAIPVILADNMKLPFRDYLDWKGFVFDWPMESASKKNTTMLGLWWMKRHRAQLLQDMREKMLRVWPYLDWHRSSPKAPKTRKSPMFMLLRELVCMAERKTKTTVQKEKCTSNDVLHALESDQVMPECLCQKVESIAEKVGVPAEAEEESVKDKFERWVMEGVFL